MKRTVDQYADLHPSGLDYLLTAISGALTAYAAGMSVANPTAGWIFVVLSLLGVWISFAVMRTIRGTGLVRWNGFIYTAGVLAAFFSAPSLMDLIPDNPFKAQIFVCGLLLWMLVFGSYLIWSDQTLLFQAVPSIAVFGLVGCYDTYRDATWLFFGFLLCFATLLARVHGRTMLKQAKESGYSQSGERMDRSATELERMRSGPWKWVAGPQWALGSAFVVILFSFLGAPIIRESVQGVAGAVRVQAPINRSSASAVASSLDPTAMRIGAGPNAVADLPVFRASLDRPRYMRTQVYQTYAPTGWTSITAQPVGDRTDVVLNRSNSRRAIVSIKVPKTIDFEIEPITSRLGCVPVPGELTQLDNSDNTTIRQDATITIITTGKTTLFKGRSIVSGSSNDPTDAIRTVPAGMEALLSTTGIRPSVYDLANRSAASGSNDYERAQLIKREIERRVKYNLLAAAVPAGLDPVETFLFETKEGYCDLFASAMTVMARSVGIPARMVVGYYPISGEKDDDGRYVILESEKHAWAELFFENHGWVVFDATEGAEAVPGGERGSANVSSLASSGAIKIALDVLIGIGIVVVLVLTGRAIFRGVHLGPSRSDLDREYLRFADVLARASGKARNFDQTPSEYVAQVLGFLNGQGDKAVALNSKFERLFYSNQDPTKEDIKDIRSQILTLKSNIKTSRPKVA
ncbi:MAG: transglutaminase domain-containing protein [Chlorobia bacterium]|nr:transglutaminase domain-containing protein [Fimbriimonadaceae bacterium]